MSYQQEMVELWRSIERAWNAGDGPGFGAHFRADVSFITLSGAKLSTSEQVGERHGALFDGPFANTQLCSSIEYVDEVAPGVLVVHVRTAVRPDGPTTHAQAVVVATPNAAGDSRWLISAFHNMPVPEESPA